ncbi:MAG: DUF5820 family protein [Haloferacaceae archaeon]
MFDALPDGWTVWADEPGGRSVLAYRPDVFEGESYPAPCLPTIYVTAGSRRRPAARTPDAGDDWYARLFLEPDVMGPEERCESRAAAREAAVELARRFAAGDVDYRALYQVPRPDYLDRLDALTGRDGRES